MADTTEQRPAGEPRLEEGAELALSSTR